MASTTTINKWLEELALSFTPPTTKSTDVRKHKDNFIRKVKNHGYGRTNQFAVAEKLTGLEEKFQVHNLDDLAAELFSRRSELKKDYDEVKWLPDILDLLLHLSHAPVKHSKVENLEKLASTTELPSHFKWEDIEDDDPLDRRDPIWVVPQYSDFSSDEDEEIVTSTTQTSPASANQENKKEFDLERISDIPPSDTASRLQAAQFWRSSGQSIAITETQAIREVLFMMSGLPTSIFALSDQGIEVNPRVQIRHLETATSRAFLNEAARVASEINVVRKWLRVHQGTKVMQLIQNEVNYILSEFEQAISQENNALIHKTSPGGVVSLLQVLERLKRASLPLPAVKAITSSLSSNDTVIVLNTMYDRLDTAQSSCNSIEATTLLPVFLSALAMYSKPVDRWLQTGNVETMDKFFIVEKGHQSRNATTLWNDWFSLSSEQKDLIPIFLKKFEARIFTIGKTAAFLRCLGVSLVGNDTEDLGIATAAVEAANLIANSALPFAPSFEMVLHRHLTAMLHALTGLLKGILENKCGLSKVLDAIDYLCLAKDGVILDAIESRMFDQIDRCTELWNDRFLLSDVLAEAYGDIECVDSEAISVQAAYTSSRNMENRRRSVKILTALSISYHLSWPIANIIQPASLASYQRISQTLSQIRRAKYLLNRRAYLYVQHMPLDFDDPSDQKQVRLLHSQLSFFVNVFYAHLTNCVIRPFTTSMREQLHSAATSSLEDMISAHNRYIAATEHACLSSPRIKPLRDAFTSILDLSIRFTDILISAATGTDIQLNPGKSRAAADDDVDFEASSFISAQSRRRRHRRRHADHEQDVYSSSDDDYDDDDDDDGGVGEGYSTFILDEDTSLMQEMAKIRAQLRKFLDFLVAGLRAVARSSASGTGAGAGGSQGGEFDVADKFELLADGLEGVFPVNRRRGAG